jgi:hypothetical protein
MMTGVTMDSDRPIPGTAGFSSEQGAAYSWRRRIGFITPSAVVENNAYEFYLMAPRGVTIALTPMGIGMQAMFWAGLRLAGISPRTDGYGRLLRESD